MAAIAQTHLAQGAGPWLARLRQRIGELDAHPARTVVLVPHAYLLPVAAQAWARAWEASFCPRFHTAGTWARELGAPSHPEDITFDAARDLLTARMLVEREGALAQADLLAPRVTEAAQQLARVVAGIPPADRAAWERKARAVLGEAFDAPALAIESAIARMALRWACASGYATDALLRPGVGDGIDRVFIVEGLAPDPLQSLLEAAFTGKVECLALVEAAAPGCLQWQQAGDASEEAERAAASVMSHVAQGRLPVAIAAVDRALTRRVRALLDGRGIAVRDETGWKLSTTRAAAQVMLALRASAFSASTDTVVDWLKHCPAVSPRALAQLEQALRRAGRRTWSDVLSSDVGPHAGAQALFESAVVWRGGLQGPRNLLQWLAALRSLLQGTGQWDALAADAAGAQVMQLLRLDEGGEGELRELPQASRRLALSQFTAWADAVLESQSFCPQAPEGAPVVILPLVHMPGREFAAAVIGGCDEERLPLVQDPPGIWSPAQRRALGLPTRESGQAELRAAWDVALSVPVCDVLWRRTSDAGEALLPSPLVQQVLLEGRAQEAADPRIERAVTPAPVPRPTASGAQVPVLQLSPTAYEDLRRCPYRFFALRQLALKESDEIDADLDKSDFGNWLHHVLRRFHEALQAAPAPGGHTREARAALFDRIAHEVSDERRLGGGEFLPFMATLAPLRDGYLAWLEQHEAGGASFHAGESDHEAQVTGIRVMGRIDRIDRTPDGSTWVIDYKTESIDKTKARMRTFGEDTQVAFYAALLGGEGSANIRGGYLNVGERGETQLVEQADLPQLRDALLANLATELARIAAGEKMHALGEGQACEWCAARGLCRRDFWAE